MYPLQVDGIGMVTALGLNRRATSAAFRAGLDNFQESHFLDGNGEDLFVAEIPLEKPWRGRVKMRKMAAMSMSEAVAEAGIDTTNAITTLICLPEREYGLEFDEQQFFTELQEESGIKLSESSGMICDGKAGVVSALQYAQELIYKGREKTVMIVATDTLLTARLVNKFTEKRWLLTRTTSNGFIPGEAAACMIISRGTEQSTFSLSGGGMADEPYVEGDKKPFLAEGMTRAVAQSLQLADCELANINLWFSHNATSFLPAKESTLAELKLLRGEGIQYQRETLTTSFGEVGAAAGLIMLALSKDLLTHEGLGLVTMANLSSRRAAIVSRVQKYGQ